MTRNVNPHSELQKELDRKRIEKLIAELERTARHFKAGEIWSMVVKFRNEIAKEAGITL